jgi:hypothetical protein
MRHNEITRMDVINVLGVTLNKFQGNVVYHVLLLGLV